MYFSESEIDNILVAVEETMQNAANLSKSSKISKALPGEEDPSMGADPAAAPAPAMGGDPSMGADPAAAPAPAMGGDPSMGADGDADDQGGDPSMGADPAAEGEGGNPDQALEGEGDISDEELQQIYSSMDPSELERHYMIIRGMLRDAYAKMEKSEKSAKPENLEDKVSDLVKQNEEMKKSLEAAFKAIGHLARPERKAVTQSIQVLGKSEGDVLGNGNDQNEDLNTLSKQEIVSRINQAVTNPRLSKSDREAMNGFILHNEGKDKIFEILRRK